jgi:hypothetical protein
MLGGDFELSFSVMRRFKYILDAPGNPRHSQFIDIRIAARDVYTVSSELAEVGGCQKFEKKMINGRLSLNTGVLVT